MKCYSPIRIRNPKFGLPTDKNGTLYLEVPCGRCLACIERRRSHWTFRIQQEMKIATSAYFVTMTYDDPHLYHLIGDGNGAPSVNKRDPQLYIKALRQRIKRYAPGIQLRYYLVSEYGSKTNRPHYHMILFNLPPEKIDLLDTLWQGGFTYVGSVTEASIKYVTKYCTKAAIDKNFVETYHVTPPFSLMSTKPPLGSNYLSKEMIKWHKDNLYNHVANGRQKQSMPRLYKDKIFDDVDKLLIRQQQPEDDNYIKSLKECFDDYNTGHLYRGLDNHAKQVFKRIKQMEKL